VTHRRRTLDDPRRPRLAPNYLQQSLTAEREQRAFFQRLESEGWVWDSHTLRFTHPDRPGEEISL
jgi:hypothetical protein